MPTKIWTVEWTAKKGRNAGRVTQEEFTRKQDADDRLSRLKRGGFKCSIV